MLHIRHYHQWDVNPTEAMQIQKDLSQEIIVHDDFDTIRYVAGIDVGFNRAKNIGRAAVVILELPDLRLVESVTADSVLNFPYVPGLLSFREIPAILLAMTKLRYIPHLMLCDGQGIAHPRRFGVASHLGLILNIPALGVGKSRLIGKHDQVPPEKGNFTLLNHRGEVIGAVLRSRSNVRPIYVSAGHRISLSTSIEYVLKCLTRFRLPETTRQAHKLSLIEN